MRTNNYDELDEYDDVEVKPNHSTAYSGMIIAAVATGVGAYLVLNPDDNTASGLGQALLIGGIVGVFLMLAAIAIVTAIYKQRGL